MILRSLIKSAMESWNEGGGEICGLMYNLELYLRSTLNYSDLSAEGAVCIQSNKAGMLLRMFRGSSVFIRIPKEIRPLWYGNAVSLVQETSNYIIISKSKKEVNLGCSWKTYFWCIISKVFVPKIWHFTLCSMSCILVKRAGNHFPRIYIPKFLLLYKKGYFLHMWCNFTSTSMELNSAAKWEPSILYTYKILYTGHVGLQSCVLDI